MTANLLVLSLLGVPASAAFILGLLLWTGVSRKESTYARITAWAYFTTVAVGGATVVALLAEEKQQLVVHIGRWFGVGSYAFHWTLIVDRLSLPFALFFALLVGLVGAFSQKYLHKEPGYFRFYFFLALFGAGVELIVLAQSLDLIFIGWEIVGLTSALLIAFFHERRKPVEHGLRAYLTYRFCDIGLLMATVWTHHVVGSSRFVPTSSALWNGLPVPADAFDATLIGLLLLWATMGKSAQVPLGGWLPRAMEGPTPSSAIFYGAISIHLGPYLLLRAAPILDASVVVSAAVVFVGGATALHATFVGRAQTDIKSALAYASMSQVGLIFLEIGLGFRILPLIHIMGHAAIRSLQILQSPSLLHDHHHLEQSVGRVLPKTGAHLERLIPRRFQPWLYRHAIERGYFDDFIERWIIAPFVTVAQAVDAVDQRWTRWIGGAPEAHGRGMERGRRR